jgi:hypothetical protein
MAVGGMTPSEVKAVCDKLEISPSQHQATSPIYSGSDQNPQAKKKSPKTSTKGPGFGTSRKKASKAPGAF